MTNPTKNYRVMSLALAAVIDGHGDAAKLLEAAGCIVPTEAGFCVVYLQNQRPAYLGDTFPEGPPKEAVQRYVDSTYLLNPVYNAYLDGLKPGIHLMADLAPDNWVPSSDVSDVHKEDDEEIGYRTPGWPTGLEELGILVDLPNGAMGEISLARRSIDGGMNPEFAERLEPFYPLFASAFQRLWDQMADRQSAKNVQGRKLTEFGLDVLSPREAEVVQLILKGHSSLSISLKLNVALPTVKTHRRNAYAKLGINTQQQLFSKFLAWESG
ncbi:MAG: helix-turn-helix transcriptional regulator [Pseudomonadota bacterium]